MNSAHSRAKSKHTHRISGDFGEAPVTGRSPSLGENYNVLLTLRDISTTTTPTHWPSQKESTCRSKRTEWWEGCEPGHTNDAVRTLDRCLGAIQTDGCYGACGGLAHTFYVVAMAFRRVVSPSGHAVIIGTSGARPYGNVNETCGICLPTSGIKMQQRAWRRVQHHPW